MSLWQLADGVFLNTDLGSFTLLSGGAVKSIQLTGIYAPRILEYFLQHPGEALRNEEIGRYAWDFDPAQDPPSPHDVQVHVGKLRSQLDQLSCCSIKTCANSGGYLFSCPGLKQVDWIPGLDALLSYYEALWEICRPGMIRDHTVFGPVRDLIDFYCLPVITDETGRSVDTPFSQIPLRAYVTAGSGFGKTVLLQILTLTALAPLLEAMGSPLVTGLSPEFLKKYRVLRTALFGEEHSAVFPVLIHACRYNDPDCRSLSGLAEGGGGRDFERLLDCAHGSDQLLFLVDGLDEVEPQYADDFSDWLNRLLARYPKAGAVFTSRFTGSQAVGQACRQLHISALTDEAIRSITLRLRQEPEARRLLKLFEENPLLHKLVSNPFMLLTTLEAPDDDQLYSILDSVISAIIERRWRKLKEALFSGGSQNSYAVQLLLGYLACSYIFDCRSAADLPWIRRTVEGAVRDLEDCGVALNFSAAHLDLFLNSLSSQSGILNVVVEHHRESYVFQDELIMCRLASLYLNECMASSESLESRGGRSQLICNAGWLQQFVDRFSSQHRELTSNGVKVLVLSLVTNPEFIQKSILTFLLCRDACSCSPEEQAALAQGYRNILDQVFGVNAITNLEEGEPFRQISRMLRLHGGEAE